LAKPDFEFKYADAPGRNRSLHVVLQDLHLERLWVIYPGHRIQTV